jgi:predicted nucleic acid-binding protein
MKLFLDTSVLIAACGSSQGASMAVLRLAESQRWTLLATPYVLAETEKNLPKLGGEAERNWLDIRGKLSVCQDVISIEKPSVFPVSKDRPVLFSALAWADVLLTLDRSDFQGLIGSKFYGLPILRPGEFLEEERATGRLTAD